MLGDIQANKSPKLLLLNRNLPIAIIYNYYLQNIQYVRQYFDLYFSSFSCVLCSEQSQLGIGCTGILEAPC